MILLGISGKKGSGKDTLADILVDKYGFIKMSFAEELKKAVRKDFGLTKEQTDGNAKEKITLFRNCSSKFYWTPREIMIQYGQFFRQFDNLWWVKKVFDRISVNMNRVVISDVRFKNEADYIRERNGHLIRLERKPALNIYKNPSNDISETNLDNYVFNFKLDEDKNIDVYDLKYFADHIMNKLVGRYE